MRGHLSRQRGAVGVLFAISLVALLSCLTLAIDIGRLYTAQRDLQRAANIAALDAAKVTNGCMGHVDDEAAQSVANAEVLASLGRNQAGGFLPSSGGVLLGRLVNSDEGIRTFAPLGSADAGTRTAVQVRLERPTPARLLPLGSGKVMVATSAADSRPMVTFGVGSGLASLNGGLANTLLNSLIGGSGLSLNALSYQGLANANVRLGDLVAEAGAATVDDYLTGSLSLSSAFADIAAAVGSGAAQCGSGGCSAAVSALTALAAATGGSRVVIPGDVLAAPTGVGNAGEDALINVGELVSALAQSANGTNAINLPIIANVPALGTGVNARIVLIEKPQLAIDVRAGDRTRYATTSQAQLDLNITATNLNLLGLVKLTLNLPLKVRAGAATARLDEVRCARRGEPEHMVTLDSTTSVVQLGIGNFTQPIGAPSGGVTPVAVGSLSLLGLQIANLSAGAYANLGSSQDNSEFEGPYPSAVESVSTELSQALGALTSSLVASLGQPGGLTVTVLKVGVPVGAATSVLGLVSPVLIQVGAALTPVLALLGVSVGNADLQVASLIPENNPSALPAAPGEQLSLQAFLFTH